MGIRTPGPVRIGAGMEDKANRKLAFFVAGVPRPQSRPRPSKRGGFKPNPRLKEWRRMVSRAGKEQPFRFGNEQLRVSLVIIGAHAAADDDNLAKAVLDSLNQVVWEDDKSVRLTTYRFPKQRGESAGCWIFIEREDTPDLHDLLEELAA